MTTKTKLRSALDSLEQAEKRLKNARALTPADFNVQKALKEVRDARSEIERAIRELD